MKYGEARDRLEEILKEIEGNEVDVDDLSERVKEAAELIQLCRKKLQKTRLEVEKVVAEMDLDEGESPEVEKDPLPGEADSREEKKDDAPF